jgi:hypothetical protein
MFKKSKRVNDKMLKEGLLTEGGGLDASKLAQLETGINGSGVNDPTYGLKKSRSTASDETRIEGLEQFNQYGDLFRDLTLRTWIDTQKDVINVVITYDSKHAITMVTEGSEHFEIQGFSLDTLEKVF